MTATKERQVVVVTGAAGGIGLALARQAARSEGSPRVLLADLPSQRLAEAAAGLRGEGFDVGTVDCDVTDPDSVHAAAGACRELGPFVALLHAAGLAPPVHDDARAILAVDLLGTINVLDAFETLLTPDSVGVCIASLAGHRQFTRGFDELLEEPTAPSFLDRAVEVASGYEQAALVAYSLAKRGVIVLCQQRAAAWGRAGARLVSLSPGLIGDTVLGAGALGGVAASYPRLSALGRAGMTEDIAGAVGFLLSPAAGYLSGVDLLVDGGVLAYINRHADPEVRRAWHELS